MSYRYKHLKYGSYEEIMASYHDPVGGRTLCCAHRSYFRMYPENSIPAILAAIDYGCDMVELDIRATKDGVCVLTHDNNLGRCTNAPVDIAFLNLNEIEYEKIKNLKLRFGTGGKTAMISEERICTFEEALLLCEHKILINLDKVMEDDYLRECAYQTMLKMERQGHSVFELCIFKLGIHSLDDVLHWIREKESRDGVKINYVPWGPNGAEYMISKGYHPYLFEYRFDCSEELISSKNNLRVGYMANCFDAFGEDDPDHWIRAMKWGANVIHTDDARLCPKFIHDFWTQDYLLRDDVLLRYQGVEEDLFVPKGTRKIAAGAFSHCSEVTSVMVPPCVEEIENGAFVDCPNLKFVVLQSDSVHIGTNAFPSHVTICAMQRVIHKNSDRISNKWILLTNDCMQFSYEIRKGRIGLTRYLGSETNVIVPDCLMGLPVYEIGRGCFQDTQVVSVTLGKNIESVERNAFCNCKQLRQVVFDQSVRGISIDAFDGCNRCLKIVSPSNSYSNRFAQAKGIQCGENMTIEDSSLTIFLGRGTVEDPFRIGCADDLIALSEILMTDHRNFYANAYYLQTADIKFGTEEKQFFPIGRDGGIFRGVYDGAGCAVSGLRIRSEEECVSLFGYVSEAEIRNVITENITITANAVIGGIVGFAENSLIENCHTRNFDLTATNTDYCNIGGAIGGTFNSTVKKCSATQGSIAGFRDLGGFIGESNHGYIYGCFADDILDLEGKGNACGGFVGNYKGATCFENCFTTVNVCGALRVGAFSGFSGRDCRAEMKNCVALGMVKSCKRDTHGGLTGAPVSCVVDCYYSDQLANIDCRQGISISPMVACNDQFIKQLGSPFYVKDNKIFFVS